MGGQPPAALERPFQKGPSRSPDPGFQPLGCEAETVVGHMSGFVLGTGPDAPVGTRRARERRWWQESLLPMMQSPLHSLPSLSGANPIPGLSCVLTHLASKPQYHLLTQLLALPSGVLITSRPAEETEASRGLYPGSLCAMKVCCYFPPVPAPGPHGYPVPGAPVRISI